MSLIDLWRSSPNEMLAKRLWQIVAFAGTGKLLDGGDTSTELREVLSNVPLEALTAWALEAAQGKFTDSGLALQDTVNEVGQRLGFLVTPGTYRGIGGRPYDGVWACGTGHRLVVETKTSDSFAVDLNKLAGYRRLLPASTKGSEEDSSILLVLGRQDTGDFEDRIKGSRYSSVMRVITVDALLRLLALKEAARERGALASFSARIFAVFTSPKVIALDPVVDFVASAPAPPSPPDPHSNRTDAYAGNEVLVEDKIVQSLLSLVHGAGASGVRSRHLQRRFPRLAGKRFREALGYLIEKRWLRIEKRGRKVIVMTGEAGFKDEILLGLAQLYEKGDLLGGGGGPSRRKRDFPPTWPIRWRPSSEQKAASSPRGSSLT